MIGGGQSAVRSADLAAGVLEALESLLQATCQSIGYTNTMDVFVRGEIESNCAES